MFARLRKARPSKLIRESRFKYKMEVEFHEKKVDQKSVGPGPRRCNALRMLTACGGANGSSSAPSASSEGQAEPAAPETEKRRSCLASVTGVEAGYLDDAVAAYNAQSDKYYVEALSVPILRKSW
jgi:hypothetical protein